MSDLTLTIESKNLDDLHRELLELKEIALLTNQLLMQDREKIDNLSANVDQVNTDIKIAQHQINKVEQLVTKPGLFSRITNNVTKMASGAIIGAGISFITGGSVPVLTTLVIGVPLLIKMVT